MLKNWHAERLKAEMGAANAWGGALADASVGRQAW
jgi:hypothetical protein